jgi:hypothetical protein
MAISIKYGSYFFPDPQPQISINENSSLVSGYLDHFETQFNINGILTGSGIAELNGLKNDMLVGLASQFEEFSLGEGDYQYCKVTSIGFEESDLTTFSPYSVQITALSTGADTGGFFGISDPVDSWSFQEEDQKIISATHTVSAKAQKVSSLNPLQKAVDFVNDRTGIQGINSSAFFSYNSGFLVSTTESIDENNFSYEVSQEFSFKDQGSYAYESDDIALIKTDVSINNSKDNGFNGSVNGTMFSNLGGTGLTTGDFTTAQAKSILDEFVLASKSTSEIYSSSNLRIESLNYDVEQDSNAISFSFNFSEADSESEGDIKHEYNVTASISKEGSSIIETSIDGQVSYQGTSLQAGTGLYENNPVYLAVDSFYGGIDQYALSYPFFDNFYSGITGYLPADNTKFLNSTPASFSEEKDPVENVISYNYTFSSEVETAVDGSTTITKNIPVLVDSVFETMNGFCIQTGVNTTAGKISVSTSSTTGSFGDIISYAEGLLDSLEPDAVFWKDSSINSGENDISISLSKYYE